MEQWLPILWYLVVCGSVVFYVVLDGFDLGVGILHLFAKKDEERRVFLNAIGPVWDGNEVWLVVIGGALFAGFPATYATLCSGFYTLMMILLAGIIFRAAAIEFRSKLPNPRWRSLWDRVFCFASFIMAFVMGLLLGNLVEGIPLNEYGDFVGQFADFFTPYTILAGLTAVFLLAMHGCIFLAMKTEGELHEKLRLWSTPCILLFVGFYILLTLMTVMYKPHMLAAMQERPWLFAIAAFAMLAIANVPREIQRRQDGWAFLSSIGAISALIALFGVGSFPIIIRSTVEPAQYSLTLYNTASSTITLKVLLTIACIGLPLVIAYSIWIYKVFHGKVRLDKHSY